jgi:cation diffusion facilitator family transporter
MSSVYKLAIGSIFIGLLVFALKYLAYWLTGSVALYSDALESIVNIAAAVAALTAIHVASQPPDEGHPYGHHKAEYFSAALEGALIVVAALAIFREAVAALQTPRSFSWDNPGILVNVAAGVVNGLWSWVLVRAGRRLNSPALVADGKHLLADVYTSVGVLGGVILAAVTGWFILDPLIAMAVAVHILWAGWGLLKQSADGLMDAAPEPEVMEKIRSVISEKAGGALEFHALRARRAGSALFIDFHLVVPGEMSVHEAHEICDRIEHALREAFGEDVGISIHVEPEHEGEGSEHGAILLHQCAPASPVRRATCVPLPAAQAQPK